MMPEAILGARPAMRHIASHVLAVDIGQANDYTAFAVLESTLPPSSEDSARNWRHDLVHLERVRDVPYPRVIDRIRDLADRMETLRLRHLDSLPPRVVIDATGVGKPILDAVRDARVSATGVIITAGDTVTAGSGVTRVPKRVLVTRLQLALQQRRLRVAAQLPFASVLAQELRGFKVSMTKAGNERFGNDVAQWREADHDDLVLAVALGVWRTEHSRPLSSAERRHLALW